jgi:competence protein ComEC
MRKLAVFSGAFGAAVFGWCYGVPLLPLLLLLPAALLKGDRRLRMGLAALGLGVGLVWCWGYTALVTTPALRLAGQTIRLEGTVLDWPRETQYGCSALVRLELEGAPDPRVLVYTEAEYGGLAPGDRISAVAAVRRSDVIRGEASDYYPAQGILLIAATYGAVEMRSPEAPPIWTWPAYVARALHNAICRVFPDDVSPLAQALATGERGELSGPFQSALRRAGLSHVVAVSGMHVVTLMGVLNWLPWQGRRRARLFCCCGVLLFFVLLAGSSPSVVRAGVMQLLLMVAPSLGRENDPPTALSFALFLLLVQNPYAAQNVGLQLSFAAVAGIALLGRPLYERWTAAFPGGGVIHRAARRGAGMLAITLGAILFTTPLSALYFGAVSLVAPLSNLLALWAVDVAFAGSLLAGALGALVPPLGQLCALATTPFLRYLTWLIPLLARAPFASAALSSFYFRCWLIFAYGILALCLLGRRRGRGLILPAGVCCGTLAVVLILTQISYLGKLTVTVLDVGQGQSVLLQGDGRSVLVDCGGDRGETAGNLAADRLLDSGFDHLDLLVLTHFHADHANGVPQLLSRIPVSQLVLPDVEEDGPLRREILAAAQAAGCSVLWVTQDTALSQGTWQISLFAPLGGGGANEEWLSLLATAGAFDMLLTGDMNQMVEARLAQKDLPPVELLVVGHHGSANATSLALLDRVEPETAVISVGDNSYGHPAQETLTRLDERGVAIYRTDQMGTVMLTAPLE